MADEFDKEIASIKAVLLALEPLAPLARASVLSYVFGRLQIDLETIQTLTALPIATETDKHPGAEAPVVVDRGGAEPPHIEDLKEKKKPRSANEMAALVAYYLSDLAPTNERKDKVSTEDIRTYFKIASFPLPKEIRVTLANATAAGYFNAVGNGEFKLNAVGHNLVVHSMPRGGSKEPGRKRSKKTVARKSREGAGKKQK